MAKYHAAFTTAAAANAAAYVDFRTASTDRAKVLELSISSTAATANLWSLARSTTLGTTSTTVLGQPGDPGDPAATLVLGTAWSVAPASTAVPLRELQGSATIGAGVIWTFALGDLVIPVSSSLVIFNRGGATGAICRGYVTWDE